MANQDQAARFYWEIFLPVVLLIVVLFGLPWLGMKLTEHRNSARQSQQTAPSAPATNPRAIRAGELSQ